ncbi:MAG TPA: FIST N-terminal domain-containing protein [Methylibium sp.]|uniref:FIST signal transduction protein n=1 Tax=Methylibium sp. TaxID=2067992 RepID=UPI002DB92E5D|nr:FIST N-terminal domain-containing protein [Methylibium sp.]HEU4460345.1 FIST N-terminal domain-containing protein [Methylibium sp.]
MSAFVHAHATHPDWRMAFGLVAAQIDAQRSLQAHAAAPTLGWCYVTDHYAPAAEALLAALRERWPGVDWVGTVGVGVCASGVEYFDEPGLAVMLAALPREQFRLFSGLRPLAASAGFAAHAALVHADPSTQELAGLIGELSDRMDSGYLFGGLAAARNRTLTIASPGAAAGAAGGEARPGVFEGGLSGVAFASEVALVSRVTQGCQPIGATRRITEADRHVVYALDGEPALDCLLRDLGVDAREPRAALPKLRTTLVGLSDDEAQAEFGAPPLASAFATLAPTSEFVTPARRGAFGTETRVRHLVGIDPQRRGIAVADSVEAGQQLAFCRRDTDAARRDLVRIATEIRSALEPAELPLPRRAPRGDADLVTQTRPGAAVSRSGGRKVAGALYVSCSGRGGPHFGGPSAELQILRHALGDVPLVGFFAAGEIGHRHLYGYTGVLTVFAEPA